MSARKSIPHFRVLFAVLSQKNFESSWALCFTVDLKSFAEKRRKQQQHINGILSSNGQLLETLILCLKCATSKPGAAHHITGTGFQLTWF